ncbi:hypothetical protein BJ878DRAFT_221767 [Calycina marina]|uniref:Potassium channel tetramerisation-type BTB domain-containing protein n=1 Tax=Calycina marina TaxID=1763456 RepID=A0A9P7YXK3_9HELO|nr:hypothetical protein BJ878DRAFT_221767 [Calycina marina]
MNSAFESTHGSVIPTPVDEKRSTEVPGILREPSLQARKMNTDIPKLLPHERVFPIQIGQELFRLSGASISSDAPSYFSQYFLCQIHQAEDKGDTSNTVRTLYIDRDPVTFRDISLHLQGYHVMPRDGSHFVKLFADAQFYSLPRLMSQLYEETIFISIGGVDFQIPREIFSDPGNSPNYFSLGFAVFLSTPTDLLPGLEREGLLRPPSIMPPAVPNRSAETFSELLHLLRGYPLHIRNEEHRAELLRDCRYFHLKGLEQRVIKHEISFNLSRLRSEITLRLEDVRQSGITIAMTPGDTPDLVSMPFLSYVLYARPFADTKPHDLILEIGDECTVLHFSKNNSAKLNDSGGREIRAEFFNEGKKRVSRLFEVIATKLNLPTMQPLGLLMRNGGARSAPASPRNSGVSDHLVKCIFDGDAYVNLDGKKWHDQVTDESDGDRSEDGQNGRKRRRGESGDESWVVRTGQWRLRVRNERSGRGFECSLVAVKLDAISGEGGRNARRMFLT